MGADEMGVRGFRPVGLRDVEWRLRRRLPRRLVRRPVPAACADHDRGRAAARLVREPVRCDDGEAGRRRVRRRRCKCLVEDDRVRRAVGTREPRENRRRIGGVRGDVEGQRAVADRDAHRPDLTRGCAVAAGATRNRGHSIDPDRAIVNARAVRPDDRHGRPLRLARDRDRQRPELACVDDRVTGW